jgi:hypothetical protein
MDELRLVDNFAPFNLTLRTRSSSLSLFSPGVLKNKPKSIREECYNVSTKACARHWCYR